MPIPLAEHSHLSYLWTCFGTMELSAPLLAEGAGPVQFLNKVSTQQMLTVHEHTHVIATGKTSFEITKTCHVKICHLLL